MIPPRWKRIARERMDILFDLAERNAKTHPERSKRYVELALRISEKYKVRPSRRTKRSFCPSCHVFWKPGVTVTVRLLSEKKLVSYICVACKHEKRYPYAKKRGKQSI